MSDRSRSVTQYGVQPPNGHDVLIVADDMTEAEEALSSYPDGRLVCRTISYGDWLSVGDFDDTTPASSHKQMHRVHTLQLVYLNGMDQSAGPATLRERRRQGTRDEIRRIALALVQGRGYESVTVELISERAGVSVRTFFDYFPDKESAMIAVPPSPPEQALAGFLSRRGSDHLFDDLAELAIRMFASGNELPWNFASSVRIAMSVPTLATLQYGALVEPEARLVELIATRLDVDVDDDLPAVIAAVFTGAVRVACQRMSRGQGSRTFAEELRACLAPLSIAEPQTAAG